MSLRGNPNDNDDKRKKEREDGKASSSSSSIESEKVSSSAETASSSSKNGGGDGGGKLSREEAELINLLKKQVQVTTAVTSSNESAVTSADGAGAGAIQTTTGHRGANHHHDAVAAISQIEDALRKEEGRKGAGGNRSTEDGNKDKKKTHAFWDTQPMPHERMLGRTNTNNSDAATRQHCPIEPNKEKSQLRQDPYNMPKGFEWSDVDILNPSERKEVYELLALNYVEDDDCMFRFDYSPEFLLWALTPPGFNKAFHLGVRSSKSSRLMAFITGVPAKVRAYEKEVDMVEINFLCVHKKLRSKRLAPVLIKEITRRVNHTGVFQAVYTAGVVLPVPVASCRYYHRSLDPKKLVEVGFSRLHPRMTMARMIKLYRLPDETSTPGLRAMTPGDMPGVHKLLTNHLKKFQLAVVFSVEELAHWLLPREGVVNSYVAADARTGEITDICSFYHLPSTIIGHPKHSTLRAAYSFYNVAATVELKDLMEDCLVLAKKENQDVFNALNLMENDSFLQELKFGVGDGNLQYYLYNWACPPMESKEVGIVLL